MWKDFFYFTRSERRGMLLLLVLTGVISGGILLYSEWNESVLSFEREGNKQDYKDFLASIHAQDSIRHSTFRREQPVVLALFDPNTADSATFVRLGLKPYIARNILRYRQKGGKFRSPEAFARIYGITDEQFRRLLPYISIGEEYQLIRDTLNRAKAERKDTLRYFKYPAGIVLDLNTADTTELKKIPGIGSGIARMIVGYRSRLGGFCRISQLQEIRYVSDTLNKWFRVSDDVSICRINLNKSSLERMKSHPYLNFYQAKVVVEYRKRKGRLKSLKQLSLYDEFTQNDLERLKPYVCFE